MASGRLVGGLAGLTVGFAIVTVWMFRFLVLGDPQAWSAWVGIPVLVLALAVLVIAPELEEVRGELRIPLWLVGVLVLGSGAAIAYTMTLWPTENDPLTALDAIAAAMFFLIVLVPLAVALVLSTGWLLSRALPAIEGSLAVGGLGTAATWGLLAIPVGLGLVLVGSFDVPLRGFWWDAGVTVAFVVPVGLWTVLSGLATAHGLRGLVGSGPG